MQRKPRIIVSVTNDLYTDQRVDKVCNYLSDNNWDVLLVGRKRKTSNDLAPRAYQTYRMKLLFENGALFYAFFNLRLFLFLLVRKSDVLLSNDLDTLLANRLAQKLKKRCELVYDTHELFTEVPELTARPTVRKIWLAIEKSIFPKLKNVITVNQSIADIYAERYGNKINVVRNVSPLWVYKRLKTREELGLPTEGKLVILQGAGINVDRGAEEAVEAMRIVHNEMDVKLIIVGDGDVVPALKNRVQKDDFLKSSVLFFGKKPYHEMMQYTAHAHVGLSLDKDTNPNYRYSLPNKLFDYMHTGTPVVVSNLIEVKRIVDKYQIGVVLDDITPPSIASAIQLVLSNDKEWKAYKNRCIEAAKLENWQIECQQLDGIYKPIFKKYQRE